MTKFLENLLLVFAFLSKIFFFLGNDPRNVPNETFLRFTRYLRGPGDQCERAFEGVEGNRLEPIKAVRNQTFHIWPRIWGACDPRKTPMLGSGCSAQRVWAIKNLHRSGDQGQLATRGCLQSMKVNLHFRLTIWASGKSKRVGDQGELAIKESWPTGAVDDQSHLLQCFILVYSFMKWIRTSRPKFRCTALGADAH